ncbi:MAG: ABC transporter ATP-binding protein [Fibrobacter sp.]|jgi:ABC-2 type transport system ATP-binding protein|nr:ABC transporter ATP-binding protein [Fibrobacter sp.]
MTVRDAVSFARVGYTYPSSVLPALTSVTFSVPEGSSFALLGQNGAGKTTLLRLLCGLLGKNYSGNISFSKQNPGVLLENPGVYAQLSAEEYLEFFGKFYALKDLKARISFLAARLDFPQLKQRMGKLSLGNKQKVQIMRTFLHCPSFLILDEPVANLDPLSRLLVWELLEDWKKEAGGTAIICSHVLKEIENWATHFAILDAGVLKNSGTLAGLESQEKVVRVRLRESLERIPFSILNFPYLKNAELISGGFSYSCEDPEMVNPRIIEILLAEKFSVISVSIQKKSLDDFYRETLE